MIETVATELFAERGYLGASMDEVARRSGISVAVVYDHFPSKLELHTRLLEAHFAQLRALWANQVREGRPLEELAARAFDAWFAYVEAHPYAWRMLFRETSGDPDVARRHREIMAQSRQALIPLFRGVLAEQGLAIEDQTDLALYWEALRGVLQGLALWWYQHPDIPRRRVVAAAMNSFWIGFERVCEGKVWPTSPEDPLERAGG